MSENAEFKMEKVLPYDEAKTPMYFVEDIDDKEKLLKIKTQDGIVA